MRAPPRPLGVNAIARGSSRTTSASRHRIAGRRAPGGAVGADRALGELLRRRARPARRVGHVSPSPPSSRRASPAVNTEPVISTPEPERRSSPVSSASSHRGLDGLVQARFDGHPVGAEHLHRDDGEFVGGHRPRRRRLGDDDLVDDRFEFGEHAGDVLVAEHGDHADEAAEVERLVDRGRGRGHAVRVVRRVDEDGRRRAHRFEPSGRAHRRERLADRVDVQRPGRRRRCRRTPRPRRARTRRSAPGGRRAAAGRCRRTRRRGPAGSASGRPSAIRRSSTPNSRPSRATAASTSMARRSSCRRGGRVLRGQDGARAGLDDPGLLARRSTSTVVPRYWVWSRSIGMTTATSASIRLVASHSPPRPTSTTATSTGASAKIA